MSLFGFWRCSHGLTFVRYGLNQYHTHLFVPTLFFSLRKAYFCLLIWFTRWGSRREWERASMSAIYLWATWAITRLGVNITSVGRTWDETSSKMSWAGINLIKENSWIHNVFRGPYHAPRGTMSNCREPLQEIKRSLLSLSEIDAAIIQRHCCVNLLRWVIYDLFQSRVNTHRGARASLTLSEMGHWPTYE